MEASSSEVGAEAAAPAEVERVEFEAFEGSKENIQPTRRGHNPHALLKSLTSFPSSSSPSPDLATQRAALESAILSYTGPDPLTPWLRYIDWTYSSYPTLSQSSHLLPLLEKCTRTFLSHPTLYNDRRYVRVWLLYAERCPHPGDVYQFMQGKGVGAKVATKFVEWSTWHERMGRLTQAEEVLKLGLDCLAQPTNTLNIAMKQLEARNRQRIQQQLAAQSSDLLDPLSSVALDAMSEAPTRRVLSSISSSSPTQPQPFRPPPPTPSLQIPIFADVTPAPRPVQGAGWRALPSVGVVDKENVVGVTTWQAPLKGVREEVKVVSEVEVWKDEECERREREEKAAEERGEEERRRVEEERKKKAEGMRRRMDAATGQKSSHHKLTLDPLRNMQKKETPTPTPTPAPPPTAPKPLTGHGLVVSLSALPMRPAVSGRAVTASRPVVGSRPSAATSSSRVRGASASANGSLVYNDFA